MKFKQLFHILLTLFLVVACSETVIMPEEKKEEEQKKEEEKKETETTSPEVIKSFSKTVDVKSANDIAGSDTKYIISTAIDLAGKTLTMPSNCCLRFENNGSISNGIVKLDNTAIECFDTECLNAITNGTCFNKKLTVNNENFGYSHIATMQNGSTAIAKSDINAQQSIWLNANIEGDGKNTIYTTNKDINYNELIRITSSNVKISNIALDIDIDRYDASSSTPWYASTISYAVRTFDVGNITLDNVTIKNGSIYFSNKNDLNYSNYNILNCNINVDHSKVYQDFEVGANKVFSFEGLKNVRVEGNTITYKNVRNVFNIRDGGVGYNTRSENISIKNNIIKGSSINGKQLFSLYSSTNINIENNKIYSVGHVYVFEDKTVTLKADATNTKTINITDNYIEYDFRCAWLNVENSESKLTVTGNTFKSTSSDAQRTNASHSGTDGYETSNRSQDFFFVNWKNLTFSNNIINGIRTPHHNIYVESVNVAIFEYNTVFYLWNWYNPSSSDKIVKEVINKGNRLITDSGETEIMMMNNK